MQAIRMRFANVNNVNSRQVTGATSSFASWWPLWRPWTLNAWLTQSASTSTETMIASLPPRYHCASLSSSISNPRFVSVSFRRFKFIDRCTFTLSFTLFKLCCSVLSFLSVYFVLLVSIVILYSYVYFDYCDVRALILLHIEVRDRFAGLV